MPIIEQKQMQHTKFIFRRAIGFPSPCRQTSIHLPRENSYRHRRSNELGGRHRGAGDHERIQALPTASRLV